MPRRLMPSLFRNKLQTASADQNVNLNSEEASQVNFDGICKLNRDPPARCNLAAFPPLDSKSVTVSPLRAWQSTFTLKT